MMRTYKNNKFINIIYLALLSLIMAAFTSCNDDFESVPVEQFTQDFVFSTTDSLGVQARQYLTAIYSTMYNGHNRVGGDYLDAATDDAVSSSLTETDVDRLLSGQYSPTSTVGSDMDWNMHYTAIRMVNTFITNIHVVPLKDTFRDGMPLNVAWKSEARFIRAYHYFALIKRYGGVPLMGDKPKTLNDDLQIPRNTFEECVNYIVGELDAIEDSLRTYPLQDPSSTAHIVTSEAAMALKSRVLLYAASPLYNGGNIGKDATKPLVGYMEYDVQRWKAAADAANYFITKYGSNFSLNTRFPNVFLDEVGNPEIIFFRQGGLNLNIERANGPVGYSGQNLGNGRTSPSQNLVDAFPMKDGHPINNGTSVYTYDPNSPYTNRDPRLEFTVLHNNSIWLKKSIETFEGGKDKPAGSNQKTKTSYYMRKFMGNFEDASEYSDKRHNWIELRYAEMLLNYAEAKNEFEGPSNAIDQVLFTIRARAGIEQGGNGRYGIPENLDKAGMREFIRNERRIEFAFEEQRYWDIRRWKIAENIFEGENDIMGVIIVKSGPVFNVNKVVIADVNFDNRRYFYPIPYSEILNNNKLVQNPGW